MPYRGPIGLLYDAIANGFKATNNYVNEKTGAGTLAPTESELEKTASDNVGPIGAVLKGAETMVNKIGSGGGGKNPEGDVNAAEGGGEASEPLKPGEPVDPKNASSKRMSYLSVLLSGFSLAIDFTMSLMSIQAFYYSLQGPQHLYGLTFGAYDLTGMLMAPAFGYWSDRTKKFKVQFAVGGWINCVGNLIYAFSFLAGKWYMMLIARLVAGIGEATLGLGSSYIASTTTLENRQVALMKYRVSQSMARMLGPFVGYIFLGLPTVNSGSSTALKLFNWYTIPGWVAAFAVAVLTIALYFMFSDPTVENEHLVSHPAVDEIQNSKIDPARRTGFKTYTILWLTIIACSSFVQFAFYSNLFALFAGQFHALSTQSDQWKVFVGVGTGAAVAAIIYRRGIRQFPAIFDERILSPLSSWMMLAVVLLIIPYSGATDVPSEVLFYAATGIFGAQVVISSSAVETFFSKKVTQHIDIVGGNVGKFLGAFYMATAAGRFAGPLVAGAATQIATPDGQIYYCPAPGWGALDDNGAPTCPNVAGACAITTDNYYIDGCVLYNSIPFYSALAGVQFLLCLAVHMMVWKYWKYEG